LTNLRARLTEQFALEKMQLDASIRVLVRRGEDGSPDSDLDVELLEDFSRKERRQRFARLAFAAWELPIAFEVNASLAARQQERIVPLDDGGGDDDRDHRIDPDR
jgi:hypothetical protein